MSGLLTLIVSVALVGLAVVFIVFFVRERRIAPLVAQLAGLALFALLLHRVFGIRVFLAAEAVRGGPVAKGVTHSDLPMVATLFGCMVLGMLAHWLYGWLETPKGERGAFDLGRFVAPMLASPIVFIPLLAAFQGAKVDLSTLDAPSLMLFLVAFENGFFWKEYFENRGRRLSR